MKFISIAKSTNSSQVDVFEFEAANETEAYDKAMRCALYGGDANGTPEQYHPVREETVHEFVTVYYADKIIKIDTDKAIADNHAYHEKVEAKEKEEADFALYLKLKEKFGRRK